MIPLATQLCWINLIINCVDCICWTRQALIQPPYEISGQTVPFTVFEVIIGLMSELSVEAVSCSKLI